MRQRDGRMRPRFGAAELAVRKMPGAQTPGYDVHRMERGAPRTPLVIDPQACPGTSVWNGAGCAPVNAAMLEPACESSSLARPADQLLD